MLYPGSRTTPRRVVAVAGISMPANDPNQALRLPVSSIFHLDSEAPLSIIVKYFASFRERMGRDQDSLTADGVRDVTDVWRRVGDGEPLPGNVLMAVNMEYVPAEHPVRDGDEVAFFPPVTGG